MVKQYSLTGTRTALSKEADVMFADSIADLRSSLAPKTAPDLQDSGFSQIVPHAQSVRVLASSDRALAKVKLPSW
jgi:hypothetical protein